MDFLQKKIGTVFLKEDSDAEEFIKRMSILAERAEGKLKKDIEKQINLANYGLLGEKNIAYELKNSGMDMLVLHDLYFEFSGLQSQIDYIIITRKRIYIVECKNLYGNIEIDNGGNFIRTYEVSGKKVKEGLYSPITQNERHCNIIKAMRANDKNPISKIIFEKFFDENYKSVVVLANPKTYLNAKFAKKEIKEQVIRADQLVAYIKRCDNEASGKMYSVQEMQNLATFFLEKNQPLRSDYTKKYEDLLKEVMCTKEQMEKKTAEETGKKRCPRCGAEMVLREAKRGDNVGRKFWGCSSYPKCRFIENMEQ